MTYGFEFFNSNGSRVFSSNYEPLEVVTESVEHFSTKALELKADGSLNYYTDGPTRMLSQPLGGAVTMAVNIPVGSFVAGQVVYNSKDREIKDAWDYASAPGIPVGSYCKRFYSDKQVPARVRLISPRYSTGTGSHGILVNDSTGSLRYDFDAPLVGLKEHATITTGNSLYNHKFSYSSYIHADISGGVFTFKDTADWVMLSFPMLQFAYFDADWWLRVISIGLYRSSHNQYVLRVRGNPITGDNINGFKYAFDQVVQGAYYNKSLTLFSIA